MSRDMISTRVAARRLRRLHRGVYAWGHDRLRLEGILLAAAFACGPHAVLSHRTAADRWGMLATARGDVDVTVAANGGRARRRGIDLHVVRRLDPRDITQHDGLPITTPARTLVDLAATGPARQVERALEQAYVQRLLAPDALEDAVGRSDGKRTAVLRDLMVDERRSTITRSQLEEAFLAIVRRIGLPDPDVNEPLHGYEPDFLWREKRLVIETDGYGTHSTRRAFEHDRRRDIDLQLHGYNVRRFTHDQVVHDPEQTGRLLRLLYDAQ
jgi:very-short-patch-repair endonuclease